MGVDGDDFLLVRGEFFCVSLFEGEGCEYGDLMKADGEMGGRNTFNAARTAWVLLTMPTTTEPCLTASCAYSTWKIRPCGELWGLSVFSSDSDGRGGMVQSDGVVVIVVSEHDGGGEVD